MGETAGPSTTLRSGRDDKSEGGGFGDGKFVGGINNSVGGINDSPHWRADGKMCKEKRCLNIEAPLIFDRDVEAR